MSLPCFPFSLPPHPPLATRAHTHTPPLPKRVKCPKGSKPTLGRKNESPSLPFLGWAWIFLRLGASAAAAAVACRLLLPPLMVVALIQGPLIIFFFPSSSSSSSPSFAAAAAAFCCFFSTFSFQAGLQIFVGLLRQTRGAKEGRVKGRREGDRTGGEEGRADRRSPLPPPQKTKTPPCKKK